MRNSLYNITWLSFDRIFRMGLGLLVGVWVARYLGPQQFGLLTFAVAYVALFAPIASLGIQAIVVRDIVTNPKSAPLLLGTAATLQLASSAILFIIVQLTAPFVRSDDVLIQQTIAAYSLSLLFTVGNIPLYLFEAKVQAKYGVIIISGVFLIASAAKVALILSAAPLMHFVWLLVIESLCTAIALLVFATRAFIPISSLKVSYEQARYLLRASWPLLLSTVSVVVYMKTDQLMLGQMLGDKSVGIYTAACKISELCYSLPTIIMASIFPTLLAIRQESARRYTELLQAILTSFVAAGLIIALVLTIFADFLIALFFGSEFADAAGVLRVHAWACIFVFIGVASGQWLVAEGLQKHAFIRTLVAAVVNIIGNVLLIPHFGPIGAAVATLISQIIAAYLMDYANNQTRCMFFLKSRAFRLSFSDIRKISK